MSEIDELITELMAAAQDDSVSSDWVAPHVSQVQTIRAKMQLLTRVAGLEEERDSLQKRVIELAREKDYLYGALMKLANSNYIAPGVMYCNNETISPAEYALKKIRELEPK